MAMNSTAVVCGRPRETPGDRAGPHQTMFGIEGHLRSDKIKGINTSKSFDLNRSLN